MLRTMRSVILMVILAAGGFQPALGATPRAEFTGCAAVSEIPSSECEALVALYTSSNGAGWLDRTNWLATDTPSNWFGVTVAGGHVTALSLPANGLSGALPAQLGNLTQLTLLNLRQNRFTGVIPPLGNLTALLTLDLSSNWLSGGIPDLTNQTNLNVLALNNNYLSSSLPTWLGSLGQLQRLNLSLNLITGVIPPQFGNLANLLELNLYDNLLGGGIPPELGNLSKLETLILSKNLLSGSLPPALGNLAQLGALYLYNNQLSGAIPPELGNLTKLKTLILADNALSGSIPPELGNLVQLTGLFLERNQLSGSIPPELGGLAQLELLDCSSNQLSGALPASTGSLANLQYLILSRNQLSGALPAGLGSLAVLEHLYLSDNQFEGALPPELGGMASLKTLSVGSNRLSGGIPPALGGLTQLEYLDLSRNQLSGAIPPELGNWGQNVDPDIALFLDLSSNRLSGAVPESLSNLIEIPDAADDPSLFLENNLLNTPDTTLYPADLLAYLDLKDPGWHLTQGVAAAITAESGGTLTAQDGRMTLTVPPGAVASAITLLYMPTPELPHNAGSLHFANLAFELSALDGAGSPIEPFAFLAPVTLSLHYSDVDVSGITEATLRLYTWQASAWVDAAATCVPPAEYTRNLTGNTLSTNLCHLSQFALMGGEMLKVYLPIAIK